MHIIPGLLGTAFTGIAFWGSSEQLSLEMLLVNLVSLCLQGVAVASLLKLSIALLVMYGVL